MVQLLCIGDVALADKKLPEDLWRTPGGIIPSEDLKVLFNWELAIGNTPNPTPRSSGPRLLAHPDSPRVIQKWGPGFATLATNHILDAGEEGLVSTIESLNRGGFMTLGAGRILDEITRPVVWDTAEGSLGIVNWVFPETHPDWRAVPGPNCWPGLEAAKSIIHDLKQKTDWVLIVVHWSDELFSYPRPEDRVIGRELAQMGADFIVGHHPHVVRGMEWIDSCPVFYSVGNFYFGDIADGQGGWVSRGAPRNREGLGVQISFQRGKKPEFRLLSFWNTRTQVILDPACRASNRLERVSQPLLQFQSSDYAHWYVIERARFDQWGGRWHFGVLRLGVGGTIRRLLRKSHFQHRQPV